MRTSSGNDTILFNAHVSSSQVTSNALRLEHLYLYSVTAIFSNTVTLDGYCMLQGCNDARLPGTEPAQPPSNATWVVITEPKDTKRHLTDLDGDGSIMWNVTNAGYRWVRVVTTGLTGVADVTCKAFAKGA